MNIYGHIWPHILPYMIIHGYIWTYKWSYMAIYARIWPYIWPYMIIYGYVYMAIYDHICRPIYVSTDCLPNSLLRGTLSASDSVSSSALIQTHRPPPRPTGANPKNPPWPAPCAEKLQEGSAELGNPPNGARSLLGGVWPARCRGPEMVEKSMKINKKSMKIN